MRHAALFALATTLAAVAAQDDCQDAYNQCLDAGYPEVKCSCDLTTCSGEDAARLREYCSSATANLTYSATAAGTGTAAAATITASITGPSPSGGATATCPSPVAGTIVQPSGQPQITACANSLELGETCGADEQCKNGAECWGSNAGIIRRCGNFNAGCDNDSQCAYNSCNNGLCNGFLATTTSKGAASSATAAGAAVSATPYASASAYPSSNPQPPVVAPEGSIQLGQLCSETIQCANGAQCWASNSMLQKACGNFNAACNSSSQCAYNTCNNGLCNGFLANGTATATDGAMGTATNPAGGSATSSLVPYTGSAAEKGAMYGLGALVAGVAAFLV